MALELGGFTIVAEVGSGDAAVKAAVAERPDACLLDLNMPGGAVAAAEAIRAKLPETVVLMLAARADANELIAAIYAGASGYLLKNMDARRLPPAVRSALSGEAAVPRALVARLLDEIREGAARHPVPILLGGRRVALTPRERQVLDLIKDEVPTREIAALLGVSQVTVRRHVSELLHKLHARDRKAAVALVNRQWDRDSRR
jgi:DNA-binding NarL/FixJ family response regulator